MVYETVFMDGRRPRDVLEHFSARFKKARSLHEDVAALLRERALLEEQHARQIQRIVRKGRTVFDAEFLGSFGELWGRVKSEWEEAATLHITLAEAMMRQVERPVHACSTQNEDWQSLRMMEVAAQRAARDLEEKEAKLQKARKGGTPGIASMMGGRSAASNNERRITELTEQVEKLRRLWKREAEKLLTRYESVDRQRLNNLKEAIMQLQSVQSEHLNARAELMDRTLAVTFEFDPEEDIARVCSSPVGTNAARSYGQGIYLNGSAATSGNLRGSTLSLPSHASPRRSGSGESGAVRTISESLSQDDMRSETATVPSTKAATSHSATSNNKHAASTMSSNSSSGTDIGAAVAPERQLSRPSITVSEVTSVGHGTDTAPDSPAIVTAPSTEDKDSLASAVIPSLPAVDHMNDPSLSVSTPTSASTVEEAFSLPSRLSTHSTAELPVRAHNGPIAALQVRNNRAMSVDRGIASSEPASSASSPIHPVMPHLLGQHGSNSAVQLTTQPAGTDTVNKRRSRRRLERDGENRRSSAVVDVDMFKQVARSLSLKATVRPTDPSLLPPHPPLPTSSQAAVVAQTQQLTERRATVYVAEPEEELSPPLSTLTMGHASSRTSTGISPNSLSGRNPFAAMLTDDDSTTTTTTTTTPVQSTLRLGITETLHVLCQQDGSPAKMLVEGELSLLAGSTLTAPTGAAYSLLLSRIDGTHFDTCTAGPGYSLQSLDDTTGGSTLLSCTAPATDSAITATTTSMVSWQWQPVDVTSTPPPLLVQAAWRHDATAISLAIQYRRNPACTAVQPATIQQLGFMLPLGALHVTGVQSRPDGLWDEEHARLLWQLDEPLLADDYAPRRVLARLSVAVDPSSLAFPPIAVRFTSEQNVPTSSGTSTGPLGITGITVQALDALIHETTLRVCSGKYAALP